MKLLDLFCGAGGAAMGYHRAGFEVVGVDINPQKHYPFVFHQADATTFPLAGFDAIHASPPCQRYSTMTKKWGLSDSHPDLVAPVRDALAAVGVPFVIENVPAAPLLNPVMLCGSMFGLVANGGQVRRHRIFESGFWTIDAMTPPCNHRGRAIAVYGHAGGSSKRDGLNFGGTDEWREAMGIDWMVGSELAEAIPPAFTEWIGKHLMKHIAACRGET